MHPSARFPSQAMHAAPLFPQAAGDGLVHRPPAQQSAGQVAGSQPPSPCSLPSTAPPSSSIAASFVPSGKASKASRSSPPPSLTVAPSGAGAPISASSPPAGALSPQPGAESPSSTSAVPNAPWNRIDFSGSQRLWTDSSPIQLRARAPGGPPLLAHHGSRTRTGLAREAEPPGPLVYRSVHSRKEPACAARRTEAASRPGCGPCKAD